MTCGVETPLRVKTVFHGSNRAAVVDAKRSGLFSKWHGAGGGGYLCIGKLADCCGADIRPEIRPGVARIF